MAVYFDILNQVKVRIQSLDLTGIPDSSVEIVKANTERETVNPGIPGVLILPFGEEGIPVEAGSLRRDQIGYPVAVIMIDVDRQSSVTNVPASADEGTVDQDYNLDIKLTWRERIRKRFINQKLPGVNSVWNCVIEPDLVVDAETLLNQNLWMSVLVLRFLSRETRMS